MLMNDTFVICQHGQDKLESFLEHLNNMHDPIKFTMEIGQNGQLPFLGVLVEMTSVYQKHTHTWTNTSNTTHITIPE